MFKKKDVKKPKDISENNNSSSDEELSDDELSNVAGGVYYCKKGPRFDYLCGFTHVMDGERRY